MGPLPRIRTFIGPLWVGEPMSSSRGVATVRMALLSLVFALLATALMEPASAGTADAPEVQDPANDIIRSGVGPLVGTPAQAARAWTEIDIIKAFFTINGTNLTTTLTMVGAPAATATYAASFNVTPAGGNTTRYELRKASATVTPSNATATISGNNVTFNIPLTALNVSGIASFNNLTITTTATNTGTLPDPLTQDDQTGSDIAGPGLAFSNGPPPTPGDADNDGLNDTCEMRWFNSTAAQNNSSSDQDNDTLTLGQECALGTDPTKADSDGDGTPDGTDPFPTDATQGGTNSTGNNTNTTSNTTTTTSRTNTTTSRTNTTTTTRSGATTDDPIGSIDEAVERLRSDLSYLGASAGGLLAVLTLCILALAVRWSL